MSNRLMSRHMLNWNGGGEIKRRDYVKMNVKYFFPEQEEELLSILPIDA